MTCAGGPIQTYLSKFHCRLITIDGIQLTTTRCIVFRFRFISTVNYEVASFDLLQDLDK
jgi:hypothetical protein